MEVSLYPLITHQPVDSKWGYIDRLSCKAAEILPSRRWIYSIPKQEGHFESTSSSSAELALPVQNKLNKNRVTFVIGACVSVSTVSKDTHTQCAYIVQYVSVLAAKSIFCLHLAQMNEAILTRTPCKTEGQSTPLHRDLYPPLHLSLPSFSHFVHPSLPPTFNRILGVCACVRACGDGVV